jgi:hypothetical protein
MGFGLSQTRRTAQIGLRLTLQTVADRYGVVFVFNSDGTFNRETLMTQADYAALRVKGAGAPSGVQAGERWVAVGMRLDEGDCEVVNGELTIMDRKTSQSGQPTTRQILRFGSGAWSGAAPVVTITDTILNTITSSRRPLSCVDGILVR